jgi:hypothetical protein
VKLNEGFSGEGNAIFDYQGAPEGAGLSHWIQDRLPHLAFEAKDMTWDLYEEKLAGMGGIVEEFIEGAVKRSPSTQFRVDPTGQVEPVSTHDQTTAIGCRSRRAASGQRMCSPTRGFSGALLSISCRYGMEPNGAISLSRSTCAKAGRPTHS